MRVKVVRLSAVTEELEAGPGVSVGDMLHDATGSRVFSADGTELAQSVSLVDTAACGDENEPRAVLLVPPSGDSAVAEKMLEMVARAMGANDPSKELESEPETEPQPESKPEPAVATDGVEELGGMEEAFERLDRENAALRERLAAADKERVQTAQMCVQMKAKFENIIEEIVAENASLVKAAERSVAIGYQHKPTRLGKAANVTQGPDGRLSAAGSFRSSKGMMSMTGRSDTYTLYVPRVDASASQPPAHCVHAPHTRLSLQARLTWLPAHAFC
eukprot:COSAG02_NODE_382_length_23409_cov_45.812999_12_plen_275_part_00